MDEPRPLCPDAAAPAADDASPPATTEPSASSGAALAPAGLPSPPRPRRSAGLSARIEQQARQERRFRRGLRNGLIATAVLAALALVSGYALRGPVLRALARRPDSVVAEWALERLAELRDPGSFDLFVERLGADGDDHGTYARLVFVLGGRAAFPEDPDAAPLADDSAAIAAHHDVLLRGLRADGPQARRGALYALWTLQQRPWTRADDLLGAAGERLADRDVVTRRYAALVLRASPPPASALAALGVAVVSDGDSQVRAFAADALGRAGDAFAEPLLTRALGDDQAEVRRAAALALARLGSGRALSALTELYDAELPARRADILEAVARLGDPAAVRLLGRGLQDPSAVTRRAAVEGLRGRREPEASAALLGGLLDADPGVRVAATQALVARGDVAAVPSLVAALARHEGLAELRRLHEALGDLTGAHVEAPGDDPASWPRVVEAWARYAQERSP